MIELVLLMAMAMNMSGMNMDMPMDNTCVAWMVNGSSHLCIPSHHIEQNSTSLIVHLVNGSYIVIDIKGAIVAK
jgi:hypothetical protein